MTPARCSAWPHTPTPPGVVVELATPDCAGQRFTVLSSFVTEAHSLRPKHAYLLRDAEGELCVALNGWRTVDGWLSERLNQLQGYGAEEGALRAALRVAVGEER